jgi:para-nitrobenzyl esterase
VGGILESRRPKWLSVLVLATFCGSAASGSAAPVQTESGWVQGSEVNGVSTYRGVPFAAPPVGALRWRAPQSPERWQGVRNADTFSPACLQNGTYPGDAPVEASSEDCLYLNVWIPARPKSRKLAVMVWIHGGGLQNGSASIPLYAGDQLAQRNVIVVTTNYRLGVFGFLAHPDLTRESANASSGNYGLLDQLAALRWVKRNIGAFGGDPDRITVFGQSSGAISISALITSPLSAGLFQRVIAQSGGLFEPLDLLPGFELAGAEKDGAAFAARAGAMTLAELRAKPAAELLKVPFNPHIIIDGHVLRASPRDAFRNGETGNVDVLLGFNRDEGTLFIANRTITAANLAAELERSFPPFLIRLAGPEHGATDALARASAATFNRDVRFGWDMWTWARLAATREHNRVFVYEFSRDARPGSIYEGLGATHGAEMPYVFGHLEPKSVAWTTEDRRLAFAMTSYWTNFAKRGDPNGRALPRWPQFTESNPRGILLGDPLRVGFPFDESQLKRIDEAYAAARGRSD